MLIATVSHIVLVLCLFHVLLCSALCLLSSFAIILMRARELVAMFFFVFLVSLGCYCSVALSHCVVGQIGLQCVIAAFPDHAHLPFLL